MQGELETTELQFISGKRKTSFGIGVIIAVHISMFANDTICLTVNLLLALLSTDRDHLIVFLTRLDFFTTFPQTPKKYLILSTTKK